MAAPTKTETLNGNFFFNGQQFTGNVNSASVNTWTPGTFFFGGQQFTGWQFSTTTTNKTKSKIVYFMWGN